MTDKELLESAAKAAGIEYIAGESWDDGAGWNPLNCDADALRLAVKLGLVVDCSRPSAGEPFRLARVAEEDFADPYAATRRAIVRAAAEVGKGMRPFPSAEEIREEWI